MPAPIACPACRRALNLPSEALNRQVQCPACKHQFHPAEASPVENVRAAMPKIDYESAKPPVAAPTGETPPPPVKLPPAPTPPPSFDVRRSDRRGKRETEDLCPKCRAFVPRGANKCPECNAEFEPENDDNYRPWELDGMERRDSEPHRGTFVLLMSIGSLLLACTFFICYLNIVTTIAGLAMGVSAAWMANKDLGKIARHEMDKEGRSMTQFGLYAGIIGAILGLFAVPGAIALTVMAM
jgi:uncharacterized CHY-type Zn-finger protein